MQEFWICQACKSMNRASADQCYSCRTPKSRAAMTTVPDRQPGVVLTPGLDEEHRAVAWTLMLRQTYVSAWKLGYVAAALLLLVIAIGAFTAAIAIALMISRGSPTPVALEDAGGTIMITSLLVLGLAGLCAVVAHSVFLGLTSMDAPALGSGSTRFNPVRAAVWWIESGLWAIRAGIAFVVPPLLCIYAMSIGGILFGLPIGLVWVVCAFWLLGDPIASLGKPGRLLKDLRERLAVPGSSDSRTVTLWSAAWGTARGFDFAIAALIYIGIVVLVVANFMGSRFGVSIGPSSVDQVTLTAILLVDLVAAVQWIADGIALYLLAQITIELSKRQRFREEWVLDGRSPAGVGPGPTPAIRTVATSSAPPTARPAKGIAPAGAYAAPAPTRQAAPAAAFGTGPGGQWKPPPGWVLVDTPLQAVPLREAPQPAYESIAEPDDATPMGPEVDRPVIQPSSTSVGRYTVPRSATPRGAPPRGAPARGATPRPGEPGASGPA